MASSLLLGRVCTPGRMEVDPFSIFDLSFVIVPETVQVHH